MKTRRNAMWATIVLCVARAGLVMTDWLGGYNGLELLAAGG